MQTICTFQKFMEICTKESRNGEHMETIGIIAAMPQESDALLRLVEQRDGDEHGAYRFYHFRILERVCWLLTCGMGNVRAANATRALIEAASPQLLVSVGIAGAVNADLQIGDVVNSTETCFLEKSGLAGPLQPLARLSRLAWQSAQFILKSGGADLYTGTAITTHGEQFVQRQPGQFPNPVLEMETGGIAGVAAERRIPLLSLRSISDGPRAPIPFDLGKMLDEQDNIRSGEIIKTILAHPKTIPGLVRMGRNSHKAADNAAIALMAALKQPGPIIAP
jgi:adenosylhomocysteine nucleosidase